MTKPPLPDVYDHRDEELRRCAGGFDLARVSQTATKRQKIIIEKPSVKDGKRT